MFCKKIQQNWSLKCENRSILGYFISDLLAFFFCILKACLSSWSVGKMIKKLRSKIYFFPMEASTRTQGFKGLLPADEVKKSIYKVLKSMSQE